MKPEDDNDAARTFVVSVSQTNARTPSAIPNHSAVRGEIRPAGIGRVAVRAICASMSRSNQWLTAPAPPAERYPPRHVRATSQADGSPATYIVVIVVSSSSDWTFGFVSSR